ncbi:hypothetical protein [Tenacibaculum halocynthiae]|uniref:hypothetical protein n=1 Tax=Tenacibaculum halocynthiae TaxID=1254437 RepID=UPI003892F764
MIKIVRNNIELQIVTDTLTITTQNTAFSDSFSLDYSQNPFLIVENEKTINALGSRHILSLTKQKEYEVTVFKDEKVYFGKLKVRSYITGARKCDLVFGSELIKILDKPISDFMPTIYLSEEIPYTSKTVVKIDQQPIIDKLLLHQVKKYPEVDFQFPEINASDLYEKKYEWINYQEYINKRNIDFRLVENDYSYTNNKLEVFNKNVIVTSVYLRSIFDYFLNDVQYKLIGNVEESLFFKELMLLSKNTNMTKYEVYTFKSSIRIDEYNPTDFAVAQSIQKRIKFSEIEAGQIKITINFNNYPEPSSLNDYLTIYAGAKYLAFYSYTNNGGSFNSVFLYDIQPEDIDKDLIFTYYHEDRLLPESYNILVDKVSDNQVLNLIHPTIDLSRHVPELTVSGMLTNCKNLFNLKIDIDDSLKVVSLDFIDEYLNSIDIVDLSSFNLEVKSYENNQSDVFKISYANEDFIRIDKNGITKDPVLEKDAVIIENEFLPLPFNETHQVLKKNDLEKGIVLLLNNSGKSNTVKEIDNQTLDLIGEKGIGNKRWKDWVRFRQFASSIKLVGELPKYIISQIEKKKKIYFDNIVFLVKEITTQEKKGYIETTIKIESKTY